MWHFYAIFATYSLEYSLEKKTFWEKKKHIEQGIM